MTINGILTTYISNLRKSEYILHQINGNLILVYLDPLYSDNTIISNVNACIEMQPKKSLYDHIIDLTKDYDSMTRTHQRLRQTWTPLYHFTN